MPADVGDFCHQTETHVFFGNVSDVLWVAGEKNVERVLEDEVGSDVHYKHEERTMTLCFLTRKIQVSSTFCVTVCRYHDERVNSRLSFFLLFATVLW